jgi:hypothetical protein
MCRCWAGIIFVSSFEQASLYITVASPTVISICIYLHVSLSIPPMFSLFWTCNLQVFSLGALRPSLGQAHPPKPDGVAASD